MGFIKEASILAANPTYQTISSIHMTILKKQEEELDKLKKNRQFHNMSKLITAAKLAIDKLPIELDSKLKLLLTTALITVFAKKVNEE